MSPPPRRYRPTEAVIDLDAIRANVRTLTPPGGALLAVVKADGYGHGDVEVARAALEAGASRLGVALVEEGIRLREAGIDAPVLVLSELPRGSEVDALAHTLTPTVCTPDGLAAVAVAADAAGRDRGAVPVHIKVDTGMHRIGLWPPDLLGAFAGDVAGTGLTLEGVWTHLARAEDDEATTKEQLHRFDEALAGLPTRPPMLHVANSAATIAYPAAHYDLVRPGISIYGIEPAPGIGEGLGLRPALSWRSAVVMTKRLSAGESISYGHSYTLDREATIAIVPAGYADGYPRRLSSIAEVLIGGRRHRVAGTVTMDQLMVDCGDHEVRQGDEVVLLGRSGDEEITAAELAQRSGTIAYEILTSVGARVPRVYTGASG
ncbi:MAG: alanine racemase [Actinomycetota bacterium]